MKRACALCIGVLVALVPSCGDPSDTTAGMTLDGPVMRYAEPGGGDGEGAEVRGRLVLEGNCLYIALDEVGERYPVVWPAGTTWDAEGEAVIGPGSTPMRVGSMVSGGGGYHDLEAVGRSLGPEAEELAETCVDNEYGEIAFVNNHDEGIGPAR